MKINTFTKSKKEQNETIILIKTEKLLPLRNTNRGSE